MENENEITDKTYTLNSTTSFFDGTSISMDTLLPVEDEKNPYIYTRYDLSQMVNNTIINAVLVFMKKTDDNGDDLSPSDDDINAVNNTIDLVNLEKLSTSLPNICDFETKNTEALVIVCHDCSLDKPYLTAFAEAVYSEVPTIYTNVLNNGNFQTTFEVSGSTPRKIGMSSVPKK